ncbi:hypothetical protein B0H16DRAFT_1619988 [Mycena metata]|uniref:Uncharacterized protein n=1 Tax=Mycena metata TaxID=1033252 RepID=A0AAD7DS68_9AGAR|nr:hypothetical protein B0H16DRAFT_1644955 [Mycena metata]KAJ7713826.1 hypothetical protein B0H16DRAFT_1619988 [Mycena metata]
MASPRSGSDAMRIQRAINQALPKITPMRDLIRRCDIQTKLEGADDQVVGDLIQFGGSSLERVFGYALAKRVQGVRPPGHYNAIKDRVLSKESRLLVVQRSDNGHPTISAQGAAPLEALAIFFVCLCNHEGVEGGLNWVQEVLGDSILAADEAYMHIQ